MKKSYFYLFVFAVFCLLTTIISCLVYRHSITSVGKEVETLFRDIIKDDIDQRSDYASNTIAYFSNHTSSSPNEMIIKTGDQEKVVMKDDYYNSLNKEEKVYLILQGYFRNKKPLQVSVIDSLFHSGLVSHEIATQTGVKYYDGLTDSIYFSKPGNRIYRSASTAVVRICNDPEMTLQGFYSPPFSIVFTRAINWFLLGIAIAGLLTLLIAWIVSVLLQNRQWQEHKNKFPNQIQEIVIKDENAFLYKITEEIFYDKKLGILYYKGKEIALPPQPSKLLQAFIISETRCLTYKEIEALLWPEGKATSVNRAQVIDRLKKGLSPIPDLKISLISPEVYELKILSHS